MTRDEVIEKFTKHGYELFGHELEFGPYRIVFYEERMDVLPIDDYTENELDIDYDAIVDMPTSEEDEFDNDEVCSRYVSTDIYIAIYTEGTTFFMHDRKGMPEKNY